MHTHWPLTHTACSKFSFPKPPRRGGVSLLLRLLHRILAYVFFGGYKDKKKKPKEKIDAWFVSVGACMTAWGRRQWSSLKMLLMCLAIWGAVVVVGRDFIETERRQHVKPYQLQNISAIKMKGGGELGSISSVSVISSRHRTWAPLLRPYACTWHYKSRFDPQF